MKYEVGITVISTHETDGGERLLEVHTSEYTSVSDLGMGLFLAKRLNDQAKRESGPAGATLISAPAEIRTLPPPTSIGILGVADPDACCVFIPSKNTDEDLANARLSEAAPDLLEACKALCTVVVNSRRVFHSPETMEAATTTLYEQAKTAIAKAEGEG